MKPITITIPPHSVPVTIIIHAEGEPTITPPVRSEEPDIMPTGSTADNLVARMREFFEKNSGFCRRSQLTMRFTKSSRVCKIRDELLQQLGVFVFKVNLPAGRPTTFYVLPESVSEFKKYAKKEGWEIVK